MHRQSHPPSLRRHNNIWWRVIIITLLVAKLPDTNPKGCLCTSLLGAFALALSASELSSNKSVIGSIHRPVAMLPVSTLTLSPARCRYVLYLQYGITGLSATRDGLPRWKHPSSCCTVSMDVVCNLGEVCAVVLLLSLVLLKNVLFSLFSRCDTKCSASHHSPFFSSSFFLFGKSFQGSNYIAV
jgi:hypothetical protein